MPRNDDLEEQAGGWLALFSNENGNVSVCRVVFASRAQGKQWATALFKSDGLVPHVYRDRVAVHNAFGEDSLVYRFVPVIQAEDETPGGDISFDHIETIR